MRCRLCGLDKPLRNSHVLPEFLYTAVYDGKHQFITLPLEAGEDEEMHQKGLRERLLCASCEELIGKHERYASQLLFHKKGLKFVRELQTLYVPGVDYTAFRLFTLSLLWRMGESTLRAFVQVRLGPHAERMRLMLLSGDPGPPHKYPCILKAVVRHKHFLRRAIVPAFKMRVRGYTAYRLLCAGFFWTFYVSSHLTNAVVGKSVIREDGILPLHIMSDEHVERFVRSVAAGIPDEPEA
jgi:hypothetical protein